MGDELTRGMKYGNVHAGVREISKVRNVCWGKKKLPNLNLGSSQLEVPGSVFFLVIRSNVKKQTRC